MIILIRKKSCEFLKLKNRINKLGILQKKEPTVLLHMEVVITNHLFSISGNLNHEPHNAPNIKKR